MQTFFCPAGILYFMTYGPPFTLLLLGLIDGCQARISGRGPGHKKGGYTGVVYYVLFADPVIGVAIRIARPPPLTFDHIFPLGGGGGVCQSFGPMGLILGDP